MIWELIEFGIQAIFVYILAILLMIGILVISLADNKIEWDREYERIEYIKKKNPPNERRCMKVAGCRILKDGTIEYD